MGMELLGQTVCAFRISTGFQEVYQRIYRLAMNDSVHSPIMWYVITFLVFVNLTGKIQYLLEVLASLFLSINKLEKLRP